jgi:hypothetical protein
MHNAMLAPKRQLKAVSMPLRGLLSGSLETTTMSTMHNANITAIKSEGHE